MTVPPRPYSLYASASTDPRMTPDTAFPEKPTRFKPRRFGVLTTPRRPIAAWYAIKPSLSGRAPIRSILHGQVGSRPSHLPCETSRTCPHARSEPSPIAAPRAPVTHDQLALQSPATSGATGPAYSCRVYGSIVANNGLTAFSGPRSAWCLYATPCAAPVTSNRYKATLYAPTIHLHWQRSQPVMSRHGPPSPCWSEASQTADT